MMKVRLTWNMLATSFSILPLLACSSTRVLAVPQQIVDPDFRISIESPSYPNGGPTVAIDEAHSNFHTAVGQYKPFADLLAADGYRIIRQTGKFEAKALAKIDVLVIANPRKVNALMAGDLSKSALTEHECHVVRDWVRNGGALLLIADHAPFGVAAEKLGQHFGITMGKKWVFDRASTNRITTELDFSNDNGLLGKHPILFGRSSAEEVKHIRSFTGQSLSGPRGAIPLIKLSATSREALTPDDLRAEDAALHGASISSFGAHSGVAANRTQGLAMKFGKGKVVALGEAGMFSAQIVQYADGRKEKFGLNTPNHDDHQFALNTLHWLSGLLH